MPQILKSHRIDHQVTTIDAIHNVAKNMQQYQHVRNLEDIDNLITSAYEILLNAENIYSDVYHFERYIIPANQQPNDKGYSTIDEIKFKGKSKFLKGFYTINSPIY